jgi:formylglycine-generating enzyme required for sulfatase activity
MNKYNFFWVMGLTVMLLSEPVFAEVCPAINKTHVHKAKKHHKPKKHRVKRHHWVKKPQFYVPEVSRPAPPITPEMIAIKAGCFQMGSPETEDVRDKDEKVYEVCVKDFQIGKYEVTQAQWRAVMGTNRSYFRGDNLPAENVNWNDVQEFIQKLNDKSGKNYRLPTEAEWEYAARAGTTTTYSWGDGVECDKANYSFLECNSFATKPVGKYSANPWGIYDMIGNVYEWTCSDYVENYDGNETKCGDSSERVVRGGSWNDFTRFMRSANRGRPDVNTRSNDLGFRLALDH